MRFVLCLYVAMTAVAQTPQRHYTLSGQVVDAASGRPLVDVELQLQTVKWTQAGEPQPVNEQGRFAFPALAAGDYILTAYNPSLGIVSYHELPDPGYFQVIHVGADKRDKSVVFRVQARGRVEGTVRDESGEPIPFALVTAVRPVWSENRTTMHLMRQGLTDDRGHYRMSSLMPGGYLVCTAGMAGNPAIAATAGPVDIGVRAAPRYLVRTCVPQPSPGSVFPVKPGAREQIDLTVRSAPSATVSGHVANARASTSWNVRLVNDDEFEAASVHFESVVQQADGAFTFVGVPPGRYRLFANSTIIDAAKTETMVAGQALEVGSGDVNGIELTLEKSAAVTVVVQVPPGSRIDPHAFQALVIPKNPKAFPVIDSGLQPDGNYRFGGLASGEHWLQARTEGDLCVASAKLGDRDILGRLFPVGAGSDTRIDVQLSRKCGATQLRVMSNGEALPDARVVVLMSGTLDDPRDIFTDFADEGGELKIEGLAPGKYLVWAWPADDSGTFAGPVSLQAVAKQATEVVVEAGAPAKLDVPVLRPAGDR